MKVYGGSIFINGKQVRAIVAAKSKAAAIRFLSPYGVSSSYFKGYWCETGNIEELRVGLGTPEVVFYTADRFHREYKVAPKKD